MISWLISFVLEKFFFTLWKWFLTMSKTNFGYYWPKGYWVKSIFATHLIIFHIWCGSYKLRRFCFDINMHCRCLVIHSNKPLSILFNSNQWTRKKLVHFVLSQRPSLNRVAASWQLGFYWLAYKNIEQHASRPVLSGYFTVNCRLICKAYEDRK